MPNKAFHIRHTPAVSMLYSDPTGCGLGAPPTHVSTLETPAGPGLVITQPAGVHLAGGRANLMAHYRHELLWDLKSV